MGMWTDKCPNCGSEERSTIFCTCLVTSQNEPDLECQNCDGSGIHDHGTVECLDCNATWKTTKRISRLIDGEPVFYQSMILDGEPGPGTVDGDGRTVEELVAQFGISSEAARYAKDILAGKYPLRLEELRGMRIDLCNIIYANKGIFHNVSASPPPAARECSSIGDTLEQEECWNTNCGATFAPERAGQHLCPTCEEMEKDHRTRYDLIESPAIQGVPL